MATCTVTTIPPPPPPPAEKKYTLELDEQEAKVLEAVLARVDTRTKLGDVSCKIFKELYKSVPGPALRPVVVGDYLVFKD